MEHHFVRSENSDSYKVTIFVSTPGFMLNPQCNDFETFCICRILRLLHLSDLPVYSDTMKRSAM